MINSAAAFNIDQGILRLSVEDNGYFSLAIKDPASGTYYRIATGDGLDISRLNASTKAIAGKKSGCRISGVKLLSVSYAGSGAPCYKISSVAVQIANEDPIPQTVYVLGKSATVAANSQASVSSDGYWPCLGPIILSSDSAAFNVLDSYSFPPDTDWTTGQKSFA